MSKLGKQLIKGLKEVKEGRTELLYDGKWHCDGLEFDTFDEYSDYNRKKEKERLKKMSPEKRKALKEKEKKEIAKRKAEDKKREEKWSKQRAKRGYADCDLWSWDMWLLDIGSKMLTHLTEIKHGWQPYLGKKKKKGKLVKLKKVKTKDKYTGKTVLHYPEITAKDEKNVILYLASNMKKLYSYINMDDLDYKKNYTRQDYLNREKEINKIKKETFMLWEDILFDLWD